MKQNFLIAMMLAAIGWLIYRDAKRDYLRPSRTLEEMSPTYKKSKERGLDLEEEVSAFEIGQYIGRTVQELIQPNMTEEEATQVAKHISSLARRATTYKSMRKTVLEEKRRLLSEDEIDELKVLGE